ncbi:MAG TPA: penicillin-binding transpeptidase domain-containing protein [Pyrinomonadaceae bacterium]|nr:penicillin-binding transpeptidase domain-containing protein [Pyrinomonadaceae bacterium]
MSFAQEKLYFKLVSALLLIFAAAHSGFAQRKKTPVKTPQKQTVKNQPLVKKTSSVTEKNSRTNAKMTRTEEKRLAEIKRAEDSRRREIEANRRQAALEAQRRREQAIREARQRKMAFESGLRSTTVDNILGDNIEGEDLEVRRAAVSALGSHAGTVVVLEPQTGKILSIVNQDWAIKHSFKPCSTIKLVTAFAGLNENLIDQNDGTITQRSFPMVLDDALAFSNNAYFQRVGSNLGGQKMTSYARILGLGEPTGLNVEGETGGRVPFNNNNLRIYSHGDDFEVTPLQLAVLVSAISNGGRLVVPQIPRTKIEKANFRGYMKRQINLPPNTLQRIIPGMLGAASYGTARRGVDSSLEIAGKTGSCIGQGSWVGLFASVAPIENPKLAVVVILRGQSERGKYAAAVAGNIYNALRNRIKVDGSKNFAKLPLALKPQSKIDAKTSAELDDGESEDSDDNGTVRQGKKGDREELRNSVITPQIINTPTNKSGKIDNQKQTPLFPTVVITKKDKNEITRPRIVSRN